MTKLLIIDDSAFIAKEIAGILKEEPYEIVGHAKDGETGIKLFRETSPDVISIDIIMPGIDGIETAREILKINPNQKIVFLSSLCDIDTLKEIEELGLKYLIAKPIDPDELISTLKKVCEE